MCNKLESVLQFNPKDVKIRNRDSLAMPDSCFFYITSTGCSFSIEYDSVTFFTVLINYLRNVYTVFEHDTTNGVEVDTTVYRDVPFDVSNDIHFQISILKKVPSYTLTLKLHKYIKDCYSALSTELKYSTVLINRNVLKITEKYKNDFIIFNSDN